MLETVPHAQGVLFDLPAVIDAREVEHERLTPWAGDFFVDALPAADAYVLMDVIHDWGDAECVAILNAIRAAAPAPTVLVVENALSDHDPDPPGLTLDVIMLAVTGGRQRTRSELNELFNRAGLSDGTVIQTAGPLCILEASAV